jgi:hypothetical protein
MYIYIYLKYYSNLASRGRQSERTPQAGRRYETPSHSVIEGFSFFNIYIYICLNI